MILELAALSYMVGKFVYHRWIQDHPEEERDSGELDLPITEEGYPLPMLFGRCRVRSPVLAWNGPVAFELRGSIYDMRMNLFFVLGLGFQHGDGINTPVSTNRLHAIWAGDRRLSGNLGVLTGNGTFETPQQVSVVRSDYSIVGDVEFLNGGPAQILESGGTATTYAGLKMMEAPPHGDSLSADVIPGYRGVLTAFLFQDAIAGGFNHGSRNVLPSYSFEASSYHNHSRLGTYRQVGIDGNPVNVIYEVLTATLGKLGLSTDLIDIDNFQQVQLTIHQESHGYSRCFSDRMSAYEIIEEVLRQIDGLIYFEQTTGKIKLKLVRNDFDPNAIPQIDKSNCRNLAGFAMGGRTNLVNKVRVVFPNRQKDYNDDSLTAQNMANAVGQDGQVAEETIEYPGCCDAPLAGRLAERELGIRSRPTVKCRAFVDRSFLRVRPGDPVMIVWRDPDLNAAFRVVRVDHGAPGDEYIALDLILDASYIWRRRSPLPPDLGGSGLDPINQGGGGILQGG